MFLNPEARATRYRTPESKARSVASKTPDVPGRANTRARKLEQTWRQTAKKGRALARKGRGVATKVRGRLSGQAGSIKAEDLIWIFGTGRTGSTWLAAMMEETEGQTVWREPLVGALFGDFYYTRIKRRANATGKHFILGEASKETWLGSIRAFVLAEANARFPEAKSADSYLVIKEPNGSMGAPLLMEALPESRMILLIRDLRDVVASTMDAFSAGGWRYESRKDQEWRTLLYEDPDAFMMQWVNALVEQAGNAKIAYDAHEGYKALIRYEDLLADTLGTVKRMYAELGIEVDEEQLARAVEKHAWENIPEEEKGRGKFYRKAKPGSWREDLTPEQVEMVERATAPLMREFYPGSMP